MKLSIIVPVYNVEKYLDDCLMSLTKQNFIKGEQEIICVNDGSTDESEKILDKYCQSYDYFVKVNKENGGVSTARNLGLNLAQGEYLAFVDSDDMVAENAFIPLVEICDNENLDGLYYGWQYLKDNSKIYKVENADQILYKIEKGVKCVTARLNIYKKSVIVDNNLTFDSRMRYSQDTLFALYFTNITKKVASTDEPIYYYRENEESAYGKLTKNKEIMSVNGNGYLWYLCRLLLSKKNVEFKENNPDALIYDQDLPGLLYDFLFLCLKDRRKASQTLKDLKRYEIKLSDLKKTEIESSGIKDKILLIIFRHAILYKIACFVYRLKTRK
jgi:glycosyltransferase involved in cell wall biosynthesis